jgi:IS5 family transposase
MCVLGKQNNQTSFLDIESWLSNPLVDPTSIYGLMGNWGKRLITDPDFSDLYSHTGRPSDSPALLSKVLLLMYHDNVSDREAEERAKYDLRWKVALGLPISETGFDHTALCRFRTRLLMNQKHKLIFERFVNLAKEAGIIKENGLQIIDSTHVLGAGAVKDTYALIKGAIRKLLKVSHKQNGKAKKVLDTLSLLVDYNQKDKEYIDWNDSVARQELLNKLVKDSRTITAALKETELSTEEKAAQDLLCVITEQDIEEKDGEAALKQGVAKDRVISVEDPEMRHGHKTSKGKFNGHKAQVMIDEESEIVTNINISRGNRPDGESVGDMIDSSMVKPGAIMGDTSYGTLDARDSIEERNVRVIAPLPLGGKKVDKFGKHDFTIDFEMKTCQCPAGQTTSQTKEKNGQVAAYIFKKQNCNKCPLRDRCTQHGKGKIIMLHEQERRRREIIKETNTVEFCTLYRQRSKIERKNAHLKQHGMRKARYMGMNKTSLQLAFTAAVVNFKRIFAIAKGEVCLNTRLEGLLALC